MSGLSERERDLLRLRFEQDLTQSEIGSLVGGSQMHVSRLLRRAITHLRDAAEADAWAA
jgi:RNA polymerase sigma-B factor